MSLDERKKLQEKAQDSCWPSSKRMANFVGCSLAVPIVFLFGFDLA